MNRMGEILCRSGLMLLLVAGTGSAVAKGDRIVIYGATGAIGSIITREALSRGDYVVGVARDPTRLNIKGSHYTAIAGDITNVESFNRITQGKRFNLCYL